MGSMRPRLSRRLQSEVEAGEGTDARSQRLVSDAICDSRSASEFLPRGCPLSRRPAKCQSPLSALPDLVSCNHESSRPRASPRARPRPRPMACPALLANGLPFIPLPIDPLSIGLRTFFTVMVVILIYSEQCYSQSIRDVPASLRAASVSSSNFTQALDFLVRFGYVPKSDLSSGALRSERQLREAIIRMQRFGNIPQTGLIDDPTLGLMGRKRCGLPDYLPDDSYLGRMRARVKRYALQGAKWKKYDLTWSVKHWPANIDPKVLSEELHKALKVWSDVSKLTFTETRRVDADIVVSFLKGPHGDDYAFDGPGNILAHAFFPGEGIGGDSHFDAEETWVKMGTKAVNSVNNNEAQSEEGVSLFGVAAHEFGHSLGLSHSSVPGSLMFPYYQVMKEDYKLPYDDTVGIQQLYGPKTPNKWGPLLPLPTSPKGPPRGGPRDPATPGRPRQPVTTLRPTHRPTYSTPRTSHIPVTCETSFDAISSIRREVFVFKGKYFWRLNEDKTMERAYPIEINHFWYKFPRDLEKIDAVYERPKDKKIVFFTGNVYWVFIGNNPEAGYPKPLSHLGLPRDLNKIDAAMVWGHNGKTYLFSGNLYWRFDENDRRVELDYPRDSAIWRGVPYDIDAAFQWHKNGLTYFFKDNLFWEFNNRMMETSPDSPKLSTSFWFESFCRQKTGETTREPVIGSRHPVTSDNNSGLGVGKTLNQFNRLLLIALNCALIFPFVTMQFSLAS